MDEDRQAEAGQTGATVSAPVTRRALVSWAMYDWATGAFFTVISTFVFAPYFTRGVAADETTGQADWSVAVGVAALVVALLAPAFGAAADQSRRKPWIAACTLVAVVATLGLGFVRPDPSSAMLALVLICIGTIGAELAGVFYNAMLPDLVPPRRVGRWSGWGWATGYFGGLLCLGLVLVVFVAQDPLVPLDREQAWHLRGGFVASGIWFAVFSLPLLLFTPDRVVGSALPLRAMRAGYRQLARSVWRLRHEPDILKFLLARMLYTDGLTTIFALGGIYAASVLDLDDGGVLRFGIAMNVAAGIGAFTLAWADDAFGPKRTILVALAAIVVLVSLLLTTDHVPLFWCAALGMGLFLGPAQAASRSFMARLAPEQLRGELFGLFAFAGKATAFLGPWCVALLTRASDSQRVGLSGVLVFLVLGGGLLLLVREPAVEGSEARQPPVT